MPNIIKLKHSSTPSSAPSSLLDGEIAVNNADGRVFTNRSGSVVDVVATRTTADIADSADRRYITDSQRTVLTSTSGTNTGNETTTTLGSLIDGATAKTTPVDADQVGLMDSAASNILRKLSWTNLKATLKTYFDTIYTLTNLGGVPTSRTVNGHALSSNVTVTASDLSLSVLQGVASYSNLKIVPNSSTPATKLDISADYVTLCDGSQVCVVTGLSATIDGSINGAVNRLDTGTLTNGTWYYIWAISNGTTHGGCLSTSSTAPSVSGYTYKRLIGAIYYSASALAVQYTFDNETFYKGGLIAVNQQTTSTWTQTTLTTMVPLEASAVYLAAELVGVNAGVGVGNTGPTNAANVWLQVECNSPAGTAQRAYNGPTWMPLPTARSIWSSVSVQPGSDTLSVYVFGFKLNL